MSGFFFFVQRCHSKFAYYCRFNHNIVVNDDRQDANIFGLFGQSFWLQIQRSRVRFPALPDFLSSSGSGERGPLSLVRSTEELLE